MASLESLVTDAQAVLNDAKRDAYFEGQHHMLRHLERALDHATTRAEDQTGMAALDGIRAWQEANLELIVAVQKTVEDDRDELEGRRIAARERTTQ